MASTLEYVQYIAEQMGGSGVISHKRMFGEYGLYYQGIYFACVCDNRLFVKVTEAGKALLPDYQTDSPYEGAKPMLLIEDLDNQELLRQLTQATCLELPPPKAKKKTKQEDA